MCSKCGIKRETLNVIILEVVFPDLSFEQYKGGQLCSDCATDYILKACEEQEKKEV
jgi:hypothetical protein